jgi:short-subunit dehydrogenase
LSVPGSGVYCVSKHGVVTLSECLHHDLQMAKAAIQVSVLCPAFVNTGIADSERNRPAELSATNPYAEQYAERVRKAIRAGKLTAADIARKTIEAVKAGRFYILTHPNIKVAIEARMRDILDDRLPTNPMP